MKECPTCEGAGTIETYSQQGGGEGEIAYQDDCPDCLGGTLSKEAQSILWDVSCALLCDAPQPEWGKLVSYIASLEVDKVRVDTAQALLVGFDAEWGADDEKMPVVVLELSKGVRIGMNFRKFLDDAKSAMPKSTPDLSFVKSDPSIGLEPITE